MPAPLHSCTSSYGRHHSSWRRLTHPLSLVTILPFANPLIMQPTFFKVFCSLKKIYLYSFYFWRYVHMGTGTWGWPSRDPSGATVTGVSHQMWVPGTTQSLCKNSIYSHHWAMTPPLRSSLKLHIFLYLCVQSEYNLYELVLSCHCEDQTLTVSPGESPLATEPSYWPSYTLHLF